MTSAFPCLVLHLPSSRFMGRFEKLGSCCKRVRKGVRLQCTSRAVDPNAAGGKLTTLGKTSLKVSKLGVGTLQWGDPGSGFGDKYVEEDLGNAFDELVKGGINFFDTAEVYGYQGIPSGKSAEQMIGRFLLRQAIQEASKASLSPKIATKFFTIPWTNFLVGGGFRLGRKSLLDALTASLKRLGKSKIDLYQIHFPFPTFSNSALMESLKEAVELGLTSAVGVSNYSKVQMEEAADLLAQYRVPLASNQVKYSLLSRKAEEEGLLKVCKERSITLIAYSPLESGLLSAKTFQRKDRRALQVQPLLRTLEKIGQESGGKSITQVALNYLVCKGALPIPGCKTTNQAKEHCGVLDWRLEADQVAALDQEAKLLKA
ncbi:hypothetical protein O6H91_16G001800 [Diphasiastrum complanatum]|uniref:Uncharacterized protein n=2 Tax=Diphasiastrum complanatum TaxID=34168 RepID=A0ACC2B980_DIPCM|nr:hypothetical protein O6H91_16G001800 [Diphasiastrum complanatum]KAJ7526321.1 hypothetical protein O6H91_16G001800 [Diphasiastrum complanatum]